jgi:predicted RNase H-like HicB family nuclease
MTEYVVIYEQADDGWGVYSPDLAVFTHGDTRHEAETNIREAIELHLAHVRCEGCEPPKPASSVGVVAV